MATENTENAPDPAPVDGDDTLVWNTQTRQTAIDLLVWLSYSLAFIRASNVNALTIFAFNLLFAICAELLVRSRMLCYTIEKTKYSMARRCLLLEMATTTRFLVKSFQTKR